MFFGLAQKYRVQMMMKTGWYCCFQTSCSFLGQSIPIWERSISCAVSLIFFSPTASWQWILTGCYCLMFIQIVLSLEHRIKAVSCLHFPAMRERRVMVVSLFMSRIEDLSSVFSCNAHRLWKLLTFLLETELPTKLFLKMVPLGKEFTFSVGKHLKYSIQAPPLPDQLHLHISATTNALLKLRLQSIVTLLVFFPVKPFIYH